MDWTCVCLGDVCFWKSYWAVCFIRSFSRSCAGQCDSESQVCGWGWSRQSYSYWWKCWPCWKYWSCPCPLQSGDTSLFIHSKHRCSWTPSLSSWRRTASLFWASGLAGSCPSRSSTGWTLSETAAFISAASSARRSCVLVKTTNRSNLNCSVSAELPKSPEGLPFYSLTL